jgi:hypothetical protein
MMSLLLAAQTPPPDMPFFSWDTWGLIVIGVMVLVLWLAFRRMFPEEKPLPPPKK